MLRSFRPALIAAFVVVSCSLAALVPVIAAPTAGYRVAPATARPLPAPTDRFIVAFKPDALERRDANARQHLLDAIGRRHGVRVDHGRRLANGAELLRTGRKLDAYAAKKLVLELRRDPRVAYVEVDRLHRPLFAPNDPLFPQQTYLMKEPGGIGLDYAWNRGEGAGVVVAVLDSGITAHPDLDANVLAGGYDFISDPVVGNDGNGRDADPSDSGDGSTGGACAGFETSTNSTWHGTAIAGVIAAVTDNAIGLAGAAPAAKILPVRVLGRCGGYTSDVADAIVWAAGGAVSGVPTNANPAEVINLSLGTEGACGTTLQAAIDAANNAGAVVVAAAGDGIVTNADNLAPGNCDGVVSAGIVATYSRSSNSAYGATIDVLAPAGGQLPFATGPSGSTIQVPTNSGTTTPAAPTYGYGYGSSISAALTSGTLAVMQGIRPQSPAAAEALLRATAMKDSISTAGLINADAATLALRTPTLVFGGAQTKAEGAAGTQTPVDFVVNLTTPVTTPVTFTARTVEGTALAGVDYVALPPTTYTIAPGQTSKTVTVLIKGDAVPEGENELFEIRVENAVGAALASFPALVQVADDDGPTWLDPTRTDIYSEEGNERFVFEAPPGATNVTVKVTEAFSGDPDLYVRKGTPPTLTEYDCAAEGPELNETCALGAVSGQHHIWIPLNGAFLANVQVSWHVPTQLSIDDVQVEEGNSGTKYMTFKVVRTPVSQSTVTFSVAAAAGTATAGSDFIMPSYSPTQTLFPNQPSREFKVQIVGDTTLEPNETLTLALSNAVGATVADGQATGTILNDEGATLSIEDATVVEGNAGTKLATVDVVLSQAGASAVTFNLATANGTATAGSDYTATTWSAQSIAAGQTRKSFTFPVLGDATIEYDETVAVTLANASVSVVRDRAVVTLDNDDGPALSVGDVSISEGDTGIKVATFTVQLSTTSLHPVGYTVRTAAVTATPGSDYGQEAYGGVIPPGMLAQTFQVAIHGDTADEANESFQVLLSDPVNGTLGDAVGVGMITNDDAPKLSIADVASVEGNSGTKTATFVVSLSKTSALPVTFTAATANGTATSGSDYTTKTTTGITIPAGQLSAVFSVTTTGELAIEANETFVVNLSAPTNATFLDAQGVGTILNDDGVALSVGDVVISEGDAGTKLATFTVQLTKAAAVPVTYTIATANGTAIAGSDYVAKTLTGEAIPAGQISRTFSVVVNGENVIEANETFAVNLSAATGATILDAQGVGTITNDDTPTVSIADVQLAEGNSGTKVMTFTVLLSKAVGVPVTYNIATANATASAGSDYVAKTLVGETIPAGQTSRTFTVTLNGDTTAEANEWFTATLSSVVGVTVADGQALGVLVNDEGPTLSVNDVGTSEGNLSGKIATFTVTLSQVAAVPVTFTATTANSTALSGYDYIASTQTNLTIPAGQLSRTVEVVIYSDNVVEPNEYFKLNLSAATGATISKASGFMTLVNDDGPLLRVNDPVISEGNAGTKVLNFTVTLAPVANGPVTFDIATANGTAAAGTDYVANALVGETIAAGVGSKTFAVTLNGDTTVEANETIKVNLTNAVGATIYDSQGLGTVTNDD